MENFDFENNIKQGLENINPMLDNDEIWNNIEPHLKKKKKRRLIFWLFFGVLGLIGILWFHMSIVSTNVALQEGGNDQESHIPVLAQKANSETGSISTNKIADIDKTNQTSIIQELEEETPIDNKPETKTQSKVGTSAKSKKVNNSTKNADQIKANENNAKSNNKTTSKPAYDRYKNDEIINPSIPSSITTTNINNEVENKAKIELKPTVDKNTDHQNTNIDQPLKAEASQENIETPKQTLAPILKKELAENITVEEKKLTKEEREKANKKRKEERKKVKEEREKRKKEERNKAKKEKNTLTKPNKSSKWKFQTQIMGSGIYTIHSLKDGNQSESVYLNNRRKYVTGTEGFGTEFRLAAESPNGFILTAGIQYQELHEKLSRQETETESKIENVTETVTEDREGNIINSTSSMQLVTTTTTYNQQLYNQYRFINFPFGLGYTFKNRNMRLKLIGGFDFNAYYKFSGSMFDRSLSIIELHSKSSSTYTSRFKNTLGIGIWTSLEWHKPLSERLSLVVAPAIQAPIGSISQNGGEWPITHNIVKLKLGVGINYVLGGIKKPKRRSRKG